VIPFKRNTVLDEVLRSLSGIISLQDKMTILEQELASVEDPIEQEKLAKEYGKLQDRYTLLGGYGLEAEAKRILQGLGFKNDSVLVVRTYEDHRMAGRIVVWYCGRQDPGP
jgi:ATP-binding cassette subfamily F protein 3